MSQKKTHEEYVSELAMKNSMLQVLGIYNGTHTKILHKCLVSNCNYEWEVAPHDVLSGTGCPKCAGVLKKTHSEFVDIIQDINPYIQILGSYINSKGHVKCRCLIDGCGYVWNPQANHLLEGHGCPKCSARQRGIYRLLNPEEFYSRVRKSKKEIEILSPYTNSLTKIKYRCLKDGYIGETLPNNLLAFGCPRCGKVERYTTEDFRQKILSINPDVFVIGPYVDAKTKVECLCLIDGHRWSTEPRLLLQGYGCPQCNESKGEKDVRQWLQQHKLNFQFQKMFADCKNKKSLPFDFYIHEINTCIEFQGRQHYESVDLFGGEEKFYEIQRHDKIKSDYCKNNNINLICIPYWEDVNDYLNKNLLI